MDVNEELRQYIENSILPIYEQNDAGHGIEHIEYVIERSLRFAEQVENIDIDCIMVYAIAAYHDIGHHIDAKNHEKVSADIMRSDERLRSFFTEDEIETMAQAVADHRSSRAGKPRSIYGKIVSSADRNTLLDSTLRRTYAYRKRHEPDATLDEIIEESRQHIIAKYGRDGYAAGKMYFDDPAFNSFLAGIAELTSDEGKFRRRFLETNGLSVKQPSNRFGECNV